MWRQSASRRQGAARLDEATEALRAMEPVGRFGTPEEIAHMALFVASDDSTFCAGAPFIVDGRFVAA